MPSATTRCKRGERKVAWVTAGSSSQSAVGQPWRLRHVRWLRQLRLSWLAGRCRCSWVDRGPEQVGSLTLKLEALEDVLEGVNNGELTGALGKLNGLTNGDLSGTVDAVKGLSNLDLTEAVDTLPAVDLLCTQATELTKQANLLRAVFGGLGLEGLGGGLLKVPTLPAALPGFTCPS